MPATALQHFKEDLARAAAMVAHADPLPQATPAQRVLRSDLLRAGWMFGVGALDAYFCDAYTDLVASTASSKMRQPNIALPEWMYDIKIPIRAVLEPYDNENWRWRMAARKMMERENVLSLGTIQTLFNKFFRDGHRLFSDVLHQWMSSPQAKVRLFGISPAGYLALPPADQGRARKAAKSQMEDRFRDLFQRRHDCIHNCDRPRVAPQPLDRGSTVYKVLYDVEFLVLRCDAHINTEFRAFLNGVGCLAATVAQAGY